MEEVDENCWSGSGSNGKTEIEARALPMKVTQISETIQRYQLTIQRCNEALRMELERSSQKQVEFEELMRAQRIQQKEEETRLRASLEKVKRERAALKREVSACVRSV